MRRFCTILMLCLSTLFISTNAFALNDDDVFVLFTTSTFGATTSSTLIVFVEIRNEWFRRKRMERYRTENAPAVFDGLALGGGAAVDDLGKMLDLNAAQIKQWGKRLRKNKKQLASMSAPEFVTALIAHANHIKRS